MSDLKYPARLGRLEDPALLVGKGRYVDDIHLPDMLEIAFVRSPHAHARFSRIDAAAALELPGVHAVYTHEDVDAVLTSNLIPPDLKRPDFPQTTWPPVMPKDEVCFVGEAVAAVVADTRYIAEDAAALVEVDYEPLPPVSDCRPALEPGSATAHQHASDNIVTRFCTEYGDCESAFAAAGHVFKLSLKQHRGGAHSLEGRGFVAHHDAKADALTVWSSTQTPYKSRDTLVELFDLHESQVRIIVPDVGGGFGGKNTVFPEEIMTALAAKMLGRPMKWIEDRREHFLAAIQERDQYWDIEVACDNEGLLSAIRGTVIHDQGAYTLLDLHVPHNVSIAVPGPYVLPNYKVDVVVVESNKVATIPVRGAGYPQGNFTMERALDRIARELGLDRAEVRRRNLIRGDQIPYEMPLKTREGTPMIYESGDFQLGLARALEAADYESFEARRADAHASGRYIGIGVANLVKVTGRGPFETGTVRIGRSGRVTVYTGAMAMGQGIETALAQICAEQLCVAPDKITVVTADSAFTSMGIGAYGSRQTVTAGNSVHLAAGQVREKALKIAAHLLNAAEQDLELDNGEVRIKGSPSKSVTLSEIAKAASGSKSYSMPKGVEPGLEATVNFVPKDVTYANGTHVAETEVDIATGAVNILRYIVVNDSGRLINPTIAEGQLRGGVAHGIGNALFEKMEYDENAQPVVTNFAEYLLPSSTVVPNIEIIHLEYPSTLNPLGVKGVGEAGLIPVAAVIASSVEHALEPFGVQISEAPISPARIIELIEESRH